MIISSDNSSEEGETRGREDKTQEIGNEETTYDKIDSDDDDDDDDKDDDDDDDDENPDDHHDADDSDDDEEEIIEVKQVC